MSSRYIILKVAMDVLRWLIWIICEYRVFYVLHILYGWAIAHHIIFNRIMIFPNLHLRYQMSKDWPTFGAVMIKSITVKMYLIFQY